MTKVRNCSPYFTCVLVKLIKNYSINCSLIDMKNKIKKKNRITGSYISSSKSYKSSLVHTISVRTVMLVKSCKLVMYNLCSSRIEYLYSMAFHKDCTVLAMAVSTVLVYNIYSTPFGTATSYLCGNTVPSISQKLDTVGHMIV